MKPFRWSHPLWQPVIFKGSWKPDVLECAAKTLTVGDTSAKEVKEDKIGRMFLPFWKKKRKQTRPSPPDCKMWPFPVCALCAFSVQGGFSEGRVKRWWITVAPAWLVGGSSTDLKQTQTAHSWTNDNGLLVSSSSRTESRCVSRKTRCHGYALIMWSQLPAKRKQTRLLRAWRITSRFRVPRYV